VIHRMAWHGVLFYRCRFNAHLYNFRTLRRKHLLTNIMPFSLQLALINGISQKCTMCI
jgi:hypothetical protein